MFIIRSYESRSELSLVAVRDEQVQKAEEQAASRAPEQGLVHSACGNAVRPYGNVYVCDSCETSVGLVGCQPAGEVAGVPRERRMLMGNGE